jgi:hypothetical protein
MVEPVLPYWQAASSDRPVRGYDEPIVAELGHGEEEDD